MSSLKTLVVLRHAHRTKEFGYAFDNGISEKGQKQAARILKRWVKQFGDEGAALYSSPKKRCLETIAPIAKKIGAEVKIVSWLDEGGSLTRKCRELATWWKGEAPELVAVCSHGDVIPVLLETLIGHPLDLDKGGWAKLEYDVEEDEVSLRELLQEP